MHFQLPPIIREQLPVILTESDSENSYETAPERLQSLFGHNGVSVLLQKGDRLLHAGEDLNGVYLVQSGRIRVWIQGHEHQRVFSRAIGVGRLVGLDTVFGHQRCHLNATALTDSCVAFVSRDCLKDFVQRWPDEALWIVRHLAEEVRAMTLKMGR